MHGDEHKAVFMTNYGTQRKKNFVNTTCVSLEKVKFLITTAATARSWCFSVATFGFCY